MRLIFFAFFEKIVVPILTSGGLAAVTSSFFAALYSAFGKYDVVHIHAEGPAFFSWLPKMFGKRVVVTIHGECEIIRGCHNRDKGTAENETLVFVNFLLAIVFPKGLRFATLYKSTTNPLFFLGIDNALASQLIPFVFLATLRWAMNIKDKGQKNNLKLAGSYVIALATLMIAGSATGIFVVAVFIILSIQFTFIKKGKIPYNLAVGAYAFFFVSIIVLQSNNFVVSSISGLFGRSATFTGRSLLWRMAIDKITERPFLGYGYTAGNINVWGGMFSSHNMFLEILLQGGLFSFLLFIAITWLGIKRNMKSPIWLSNTAFLAIFCMLLKGLMETSIPTFYYVIITIAYDAPYLVKQYNERREDIVST